MSQQNLPEGQIPVEIPMFGFDSKERSKSIPIKLLAQSIRVEDNLGRAYRTRPVQAWTLLTMIISMLKDAEVNYKVHPIVVRSDSSGVALSDEDRADKKYDKTLAPINKWIFDQLITKIDIPHIGGDLTNGTIAVAYTNKGINVALGLNVHICDNLSILGGQQMRTYKFLENDPYNWDGMKLHLRDWITNLDQKLKVESEIMERMMAREVSNEIAIDQVIGKLYQKAVEWRYRKGPQAPFDISGMSTFVQNVLKHKREEVNNVWDLYNWGTSVMKPDTERIEYLIESNRMYADFLCEEFAVEREDLVQEVQTVEG